MLDFVMEIVSITFIVMMMMLLVDFANVKTQGRIISLMKRYPGLQIVLCAVIGLIPGCVGIFAVVSLYTHRLIGFGALLAAAIAGFGDEAFFMLSFIPKQTLWLTLILFSLAIGVGYLTDYWFQKRKNRPNSPFLQFSEMDCKECIDCEEHSHNHKTQNSKHIRLFRIISLVVVGLFIIGIFSGVIGDDHGIGYGEDGARTVPTNELHAVSIDGEHATPTISGENMLFLVISFATFILLLTVNKHFFEEHILNHLLKKHLLKTLFWVVIVMLLVRIFSLYVDVSAFAYHSWGKYILLLFALLLGFIPQSGPHLIILFLFIDGIVPFSTLIANSIMQEGHGGIPLLAYSPKHFLWTKIIKFVIALGVGLLGVMLGV